MEDLLGLHDDHVFLRREAVQRDYSDDDLKAWIRGGLLVRIRHGAYAPAESWAAADPLERHRMRAHAVLLSHDVPLALSHTSAAIEHGLRTYDARLDRVHVLCLGSQIARTTPDVVYHRGTHQDSDIVLVGGRPVVQPVLAGLQTASLVDTAGGLVVLDSLIDLGLGSLDDVHARFERISGHPFSRHLQVTVRLVRAGANSVGESLSRHRMWVQRVPEPVLQFEVRAADGTLLGITDFAWPEYGVLGEFDGLQKYGRLLRPGETPGDAVTREKKREDRLREETGWLMVRLIWADLFQSGLVAAKVGRQLERGRLLRAG